MDIRNIAGAQLRLYNQAPTGMRSVSMFTISLLLDLFRPVLYSKVSNFRLQPTPMYQESLFANHLLLLERCWRSAYSSYQYFGFLTSVFFKHKFSWKYIILLLNNLYHYLEKIYAGLDNALKYLTWIMKLLWSQAYTEVAQRLPNSVIRLYQMCLADNSFIR